MIHQPVVTFAAGVFLCAFGAAGALFLTKRYPDARFLRGGYGLMSAGGALFAVWGISRASTVGVVAAAFVAAGAAAGIFGVLRKEVRLPTQ